jgi:excisionase family DNA binding protein
MSSPDKILHNSPKQIQKRLFTLKEAAQYLGRSVWSMRELIWAGVIPVVRQEGGRKIYLDKIDLDSFVEKNKTEYL